MNLRITFLDTSSIFHILGAIIGVNLVLKKIDNPYYWFATGWRERLIRGFIGFLFNTVFLSFLSKNFLIFLLYFIVFLYIEYVTYENLTSDFFIYSIFYGLSGVFCYGYLPLIFSKVNLTNNDYMKKKFELIIKRKNSGIIDDIHF